MASPTINLRIDRELHAHLVDYCKEYGKTISQAVRDRLRHGLGLVNTGFEAGWREGYTAAYAEAQRGLEDRAHETPSTPQQAARKRRTG